jgi:hypothetical protein
MLPESPRMAEKIEFYQIYFKPTHLPALFPFAIPYYNATLTPFFENSVIKTLIQSSSAEKIGVCSWALKHKMKMCLRPLTESVLHEDYDVLSFSRMSKHHKMLPSAEAWHPGFTALLTKIMSQVGYKVVQVPKYPIYQNAFVARTEIYREYVKDFLVPAMEVMSTDAECWKDSGYTKLKREPLSDNAKVDLGVGYYPMHTFLCERFFSQWLETKKLNVKYL